MSERNGSPPSDSDSAASEGGVHEQAQFTLSLLFDLVGDGVNVLEIRTEDSSLVEFSDLENERFGAIGVDFVEPEYGDTEKMIFDDLVGAQGENDVVLVLPCNEVGEVRVFDRRERVQVERDLCVKVIVLQGFVEFWDSEELVDVERVL